LPVEGALKPVGQWSEGTAIPSMQPAGNVDPLCFSDKKANRSYSTIRTESAFFMSRLVTTSAFLARSEKLASPCTSRKKSPFGR